MIDEQELYALGDADHGPDIPCRSVEAVIARGKRLRRRRHALRTAAAGTVVIGLIGTGLLVRGQQSGSDPDVRAADDPTTTTSDVRSSPPPPPPDCDDGVLDREDFVAPEEVAAADVADDLRVLPSWTPSEGPVTLARGNRWTDPCPDTAPHPVDEALLLKADGGDGIADAIIRLSGPQPRPTSDNWGLSQEPTELRGGTAIRMDPSSEDDVAFAWTAPDGWSWQLTGQRIDERILRTVAEALILDSSPEGDEPVAALAPEDVPPGFEIAWQMLGAPTPVEPVSTSWSVQIGGSLEAEQSGIQCFLEARPRMGEASFASYGGIGDVHVTVNGQDALWGSSAAGPGTALTWQLEPGVLATAGCVDWDSEGNQTLPLETIVQLAESVEPVPTDDPRLPD